jgi:hypothetical protein
MLGGRTGTEHAQLADLHPGRRLMGNLATFITSKVGARANSLGVQDVPVQPDVDAGRLDQLGFLRVGFVRPDSVSALMSRSERGARWQPTGSGTMSGRTQRRLVQRRA